MYVVQRSRVKAHHPITDELLDQLLANYQKPEDLIGADGILKQLTKKLVERARDPGALAGNVRRRGVAHLLGDRLGGG